MIELKNVSKVFNLKSVNEKVALSEINLTIADGDYITVIGGNGAGKSTMLNSIADEKDENYSAYKKQSETAYRLLVKYSKGVGQDKAIKI